jgi:hypothetical protein
MRDHLAPLARIARLEAPSFPALASVKMPRGAPSVQKLLAHADGMAVVAHDYRDVFIGAGLQPTFVEDLRAAVEDIRVTLADRTGKRGAQAGATSGIDRALNACNRYKAVLDSFIKTDARDDAVLLARWSIIKRVPRPRGRRKQNAGATAAPHAEAPPETQAEAQAGTQAGTQAQPDDKAAASVTPVVTIGAPILDPSRLLAVPASPPPQTALAISESEPIPSLPAAATDVTDHAGVVTIV